MLRAIFGGGEKPPVTEPQDVPKKLEKLFDGFMAGDPSRRKRGLKKKRG